MALSDMAVRNAKPKDKPYKLGDGRGLYLLVGINGSRLWRFDYMFQGKRKLISLGAYPDVSLAKARERLAKVREQVADGKDPSAERKLQKLIGWTSENSFQKVAEEWVSKLEKEGRAPKTIIKLRWLLSFAYPVIGKRPMTEISAPELLGVLRILEKRGRYESARRLRSTCGAVFRYAIATGRATVDPTPALLGAITTPKVVHRAALTTPNEVGALMRAIEAFEGQPIIRAALRLAPHVFVRPGELRTAEWTEIDFDKALWTIPENKTKMRRAHRVPLSRQAIEILRGVHEFTGQKRFVFHSVRTFRRPISDNTVNACLRRLGYDKTEMTGHGFRAMASTLLNESGLWNADAIERQLAHEGNDDVRRAYLRAEFWEERVRMMQSWSDELDRLRGGLVEGRSNRVPLPRRGRLK
jgi:integrase